jgi:MFS family permease
MPFLLICYVCSYLDRINVGFAKLQMLHDLGFSEAAYGLGAGVFFIGYFFFEVPSNIIMLRTGPRTWIARIMITWGLISAAMIFVHSIATFYILRFFLGAAEAGFIPGVIYYLNCWFPSEVKGRSIALFMAGIPIAGMIGGPLSGVILNGLQNVAGFAGWQWVFIIEAIPSVIAGLACLLWLDDTPEAAKWLTSAEKSRIASDLQRDHTCKPLASTREGLLSSKVWALSLLYVLFIMGLYGISFWLPSIIKQSGVTSVVTIGLLTAIPYTAALITMIVIGYSSDRQKERRWHLAGPALLGAAGLLISVAYSHDVTMAVIGLTIGAAGSLTCIPQFYVVPSMILSGGAAAAGFAVINSVGNLAGFVSPYMLGYVKQATGSTNNGIMIIAACLVIAAVSTLLVPKKLVNR